MVQVRTLTKKERDVVRLYTDLMEEAKIRITTISDAATGRTGFSSVIVREFCYLQLRMLCELIALACLAAHGDITAAQPGKLRKTYEADKMLAQLESLHQHFYPQPILLKGKRPDGAQEMEIQQSGNFLTKADLLSLYARSGDHLHRGSFKKLMSPKMPIVINFPEIVGWAQKMENLLSMHVVALLGGREAIVCILRNIDDNYRVQVTKVADRPT